MNNKDKKFIENWAQKIEQGVIRHYIKTILIVCVCSVVVILFYTWGNVPENNYLLVIFPFSLLILGLGLPLGLFFSWYTWYLNNNKYNFLTTGNKLQPGKKKKKWYRYDRIWHIAVLNIGAIYFILLYTSIFLFDSGEPTLLKYSIVGIILSYFVVQISYAFYRYWIDKLGQTKHFPLIFKCLFIIVMLMTLLFWLIFFIR